MKSSTKRLLLIGGSLLVIGGIAYYFIRNSGDDSPEESNIEPDPNYQPDQNVNPLPISSDCPSELNSVQKIKAFQDFMDTIGPWVKGSDGKYKKLVKGSGYGLCGPSTKAAWKVYGSRYLSNESSLGLVTKRIGSSAKIGKNADGSNFAYVNVNGGKNQIKFFNNGRFVFLNISDQKEISRGNYSDGGRTLVVTDGKKAGNTFQSGSFWKTVANLF